MVSVSPNPTIYRSTNPLVESAALLLEFLSFSQPKTNTDALSYRSGFSRNDY